tara:strand:- start:9225 stop:9788 length:564 start_codon:yes stop_codon:yes gene_type:complete
MADNRFWAASTSEPKRAYRFVLNLNGVDSWVVTKVNRPGFAVTEASHQYLNHTFYYPGRVEYNTVSFTMVDPLEPNSTAYAFALLSQSGYSLPNTKDYNTISKSKSLKALGTPTIHTYNADGNIVETFTLINAWVKNVEMGDYDYSVDDLINITVEMRYDFARYDFKIGTPKTAVDTAAARKMSAGK